MPEQLKTNEELYRIKLPLILPLVVSSFECAPKVWPERSRCHRAALCAAQSRGRAARAEGRAGH